MKGFLIQKNTPQIATPVSTHFEAQTARTTTETSRAQTSHYHQHSIKTGSSSQPKIATWGNMFGDFLGHFKRKQSKGEIPSPLKRSPRRKQVEKDPIETYTPLARVNQFQLSPKLRYKFKQYLNGNKEINELIQDCNSPNKAVINEIREKRHMRRSVEMSQPSFTKSSLLSRENATRKQSQFKFLKFLGVEDQAMQTKIKVQKRYDLIRRLVQKNIDAKNQQKMEFNFRDVQLFKQIHAAFEQKRKQVNNGDMIHLNGEQRPNKVVRQRGSIKICDDQPIDKQISKSQLSLDIRMLRMQAQNEVKIHAENYLEDYEHQQHVEDQKSKRKVKLNIVSDRKKDKAYQQILLEPDDDKPPFVEFDKSNPRSNTSRAKRNKEPFLKDIRLYQYLNQILPSQEDELELIQDDNPPPSRNKKQINKSRTFHHLQNFRTLGPADNLSVSNDSTLQSLMECKLEELYDNAQTLQQRLKKKGHENFIRTFKMIEKLENVSNNIIKTNIRKLHTPRVN